MQEIAGFEASEPNRKFPYPIPAHVLSKQKGSDVFVELQPLSFGKIVEVAELDDLARKEKIETLYDLISTDINTKKSALLRSANFDKATRSVIRSELDRIGFRDFTRETDFAKKEEMVADYLGKQLYVLIDNNPSSEEIKKVGKVLELSDPNYVVGGLSLLHLATSNGNGQVCSNFGREWC